MPPSRAAFRHPSSSRFAISSVRVSCAGGVASSSPSALVDKLSFPNALDTWSSSPMHFRTCVPKSFSTITMGLGEDSSAVDGVNTTDGCGGMVGFVWIDNAGRRFARSRFEAGGRSEGEALRSRDRPVGALRAGGLKEGDDGEPFWDILLHFSCSCLESCEWLRWGLDGLTHGGCESGYSVVQFQSSRRMSQRRRKSKREITIEDGSGRISTTGMWSGSGLSHLLGGLYRSKKVRVFRWHRIGWIVRGQRQPPLLYRTKHNNAIAFHM